VVPLDVSLAAVRSAVAGLDADPRDFKKSIGTKGRRLVGF